ncbi:hypothetical protein ACKWTF_007315 [Chironomus riparius]
MYAKISKFVNIEEYCANFESDLNKDEKAKSFWSKQILILIDNFVKQIRSIEEETDDDNKDNKNHETKEEKIIKFKTEYQAKVNKLMEDPTKFLSIRQLLQLNEELLKKYEFGDIWRYHKLEENRKALSLLENRLQQVATNNTYSRFETLFYGLLSANIFDSGATAVQKILKENKNFNFGDAMLKVQKRPWLVDNFDSFMDVLLQGKIKCITFFADNCGIDLCLGVLPLIVEFLKLDIKVILCANSGPSLNDITINELINVIETAGEFCDLIKSSYENRNLILCENGQYGCCLNFLEINETLLDLMISMEVDLIVIEGVGRSIHSNFNAKFKCQSLKLAVIKNNFLAEGLGGKIFDAICKFECYK